MCKSKTVIIIAGPTASGKTNLSLQLAAQFNTNIISADSRQCFKELNIGVAKPPEEALHSIRHYFINSHSIHDIVNAQVYEQYALAAVKEIFEKNDVAIMVGGTGMYIKAFCEGLDVIPEINIGVRNEIINNYKQYGLQWLQKEIQTKDPDFWLNAEQKNPQRLMRALEVIVSTGNSLNHYRQDTKNKRDFNIVKMALLIPKEELHKRIDNRVDEMINTGLIQEAESLKKFQHLNALQTVGYKEVFACLNNQYSFKAAIEKIKIHTKQYAKRQLTWFKKDKEFNWLNNENDVHNILTPRDLNTTVIKS